VGVGIGSVPPFGISHAAATPAIPAIATFARSGSGRRRRIRGPAVPPLVAKL
jgi:hypothetical protein